MESEVIGCLGSDQTIQRSLHKKRTRLLWKPPKNRLEFNPTELLNKLYGEHQADIIVWDSDNLDNWKELIERQTKDWSSVDAFKQMEEEHMGEEQDQGDQGFPGSYYCQNMTFFCPNYNLLQFWQVFAMLQFLQF